VGPSPGAAPSGITPYFSWKNWRPIFSHHRLSVLQCHPYLFSHEKLTTFFLFFWSSLSLLFISLVHSGVARYFRHVAMLQKKLRLLLWGPFCGGPYSAEHAEHA